jgi:hypothetical protein
MDASRRSLRIAFMIAAALISSATLAAQDVTLRFKWTKSEEIRYRTTIQTDMQMSGMPGMGDMNVTMTMVQLTKMTVDDVAADGSATLRNTYESIKMTMQIPMMGEVTYDSAAPPPAGSNAMADMIGKSVGAMVGEAITMVVAPNGKVGKIDGLSRVAEKVKAATPGAGAPGMNTDSFFSEDAQRSAIEQSFAWMPEKPVRPGDTWKNEFKIPSPLGSQVNTMVNTLKGQETVGGNNVARIATTGTIKPTGEPGTMGPMTVTMGEGKSTGETLFDTKLGRVRKSTGTMTQPLSMRMSGPDGTDIAIQAVQKTTSTMELIEK